MQYTGTSTTASTWATSGTGGYSTIQEELPSNETSTSNNTYASVSSTNTGGIIHTPYSTTSTYSYVSYRAPKELKIVLEFDGNYSDAEYYAEVTKLLCLLRDNRYKITNTKTRT